MVLSSRYCPGTGEVTIFGHSLDSQRELAKKKVGVVPQEFNFNQFEKVFDIVVTQAGFYGIPGGAARVAAEKYLRRLGLWEKRDSQARELSGATGLLFRRNSQSGGLEAIPRTGTWGGLNSVLHAN